MTWCFVAGPSNGVRFDHASISHCRAGRFSPFFSRYGTLLYDCRPALMTIRSVRAAVSSGLSRPPSTTGMVASAA
jgi:hypothetical protein